MKLTKAQQKNNERIRAWLREEPFKENSRDKNPTVPELDAQRVMAEYTPSDPTGAGQHFTPAEMGMNALGLIPDLWDFDLSGVRILEPAAGIGGLIQHMAGKGAEIHAYDLDEECVQIGQKLYPDVHWHCEIPFNDIDALEGTFDFVASNPPFGTIRGMGPGDEMCEGRCKRSEHIFLELCIRALKPGGQALVIAPFNLVDKMPKAGKKWLDEHTQLDYGPNLDQYGKTRTPPLPGKFALTNIDVHAFVFRRKEQDVAVDEAQEDAPAQPEPEFVTYPMNDVASIVVSTQTQRDKPHFVTRDEARKRCPRNRAIKQYVIPFEMVDQMPFDDRSKVYCVGRDVVLENREIVTITGFSTLHPNGILAGQYKFIMTKAEHGKPHLWGKMPADEQMSFDPRYINTDQITYLLLDERQLDELIPQASVDLMAMAEPYHEQLIFQPAIPGESENSKWVCGGIHITEYTPGVWRAWQFDKGKQHWEELRNFGGLLKGSLTYVAEGVAAYFNRLVVLPKLEKEAMSQPTKADVSQIQTITLTSFDNGRQFGYDDPQRLGIWMPYQDVNGIRYADAWVIWDSAVNGGPLCVKDKEWSDEHNHVVLSDKSLAEAIKKAEAHFGVQIVLEGEPTWKDMYTPTSSIPTVQLAKGVPAGSLSILWTAGTIVWTGDTRFFQKHGEAQFHAAWDWLVAKKTEVEKATGYTVVEVRKDYDSGFCHSVGEVKPALIADVVRNCYAEPTAPDGWWNPGIHLAAHIRAQMRIAHNIVLQRNSVVYDDALWDEFVTVCCKDDPLLDCITTGQTRLWSPDQWIASLGVDVQKRQTWTYIKPSQRKLADRQGDLKSLLAALDKPKTTTAKRNTILSELADLGQLPAEYVSAERAGKPEYGYCAECGDELTEAGAAHPTESHYRVCAGCLAEVPPMQMKLAPAAPGAISPDEQVTPLPEPETPPPAAQPAPDKTQKAAAELYLFWKKVYNAYPSAEECAQAHELLIGGSRQAEGAEFRRYCRVACSTIAAKGNGADAIWMAQRAYENGACATGAGTQFPEVPGNSIPWHILISEPTEAVQPNRRPGLLYRDWLSVINGDESASPSEERLAQYDQWAGELMIGGRREDTDTGAEFRRFCRIYLKGRQWFDLRTIMVAYQNGQDFPAPDGWECLVEPAVEAVPLTPISDWDISWEVARAVRADQCCTRCQAQPQAGEEWLRGWGSKHPTSDPEERSLLCPTCQAELHRWKESLLQERLAEEQACKAAVKAKQKAQVGPAPVAEPTETDVAEYEQTWDVYFETGAVATVKKTAARITSAGVLIVALARLDRGNPATVEERRKIIESRIKQLQKAA